MKKYQSILTMAFFLTTIMCQQALAIDLTANAVPTRISNYVHTIIPQTTSGGSGPLIESIQYFDGLGRPLQSVHWQASPSHRDIVIPVCYDQFGREDKKYLPYAEQNDNGSLVVNPIPTQSSYYEMFYGSTEAAKAYSQTVFELSPLNRVLQQGAPGTAWQPNSNPSQDHSVKFDYDFNVSGEVRMWKVADNGLIDGGYYNVKSLFKTTTWDENNDTTSATASKIQEFKDKQGKVILKRSFNGTEALSTYYVYDEAGLLRYVFPPKATDDETVTTSEMSDLCYSYRYDGLKRMIMKKLPGADSINMIYDNRDRLVLTQDGVSRPSGKWFFTKYDCLNRPVITGYFYPGQNYSYLVNAFSGYDNPAMYESTQTSGNTGYTLNDSYPSGLSVSEADILSITYYDNYVFLGVTGFYPYSYSSSYDIDTYSGTYLSVVKGKPTGSKIKALDGNEFNGSAKWLYQASYYDDRYRVIQSRRTLFDNSSGGVETQANLYDFTGKLLQNKLVQDFNGSTTMVDKFLTYDHQGRLTKTEQQIDGDENGRVTISENIYNPTGQLITKKLHKTGLIYLQNVDYAYNLRGWLTSINNPDNLSGDLFAERLLYETPETNLTASTDVQYNGNISGMVWNSDQKAKQGYRFNYDGLNRLTLGDHKNYSSGWNDNYNYEERSLTYDQNGNIGTLVRTDQNGNTADNFSYAYSGNKLSSINGGTSYTYDLNGNTQTDGLRAMTIGYNVLNLPNTISKSSESISYIYSASGEKLAKRMKDNSYNYYAGSMVYNNDKSLKYILFEEGMVNKSSGAYTYEYHLKDHLGNTRVAFQPYGYSTLTTQVAEYYPFGSSYLPLNPAGTNKYLYNGKEKQDDVLGSTALDEYDYGARFYYPRICRWHVIDGKADKYYPISPYVYVLNDPLKFIDPDGNEIKPVGTAQEIKRINNALTIISITNPEIYRALEQAKEVFEINMGNLNVAETNNDIGAISTMNFASSEKTTERGSYTNSFTARNGLKDESLPSMSEFNFTAGNTSGEWVQISEKEANELVSIDNNAITIDMGLSAIDFAKTIAHEFGHAAFTLTNKAKAFFLPRTLLLGHEKGNPNGDAAIRAEEEFDKNYKAAKKKKKEEDDEDDNK